MRKSSSGCRFTVAWARPLTVPRNRRLRCAGRAAVGAGRGHENQTWILEAYPLSVSQGLNTTPVHGHAALFGVYGMLGIGLMLFCLRGLTAQRRWRTGALWFSFWAMNVGLALMILLSLLPVGILQTWASVEPGTWFARSAEFMQRPVIHWFVWLRIIGDSIFAIGALVLGWFIVGLKTGWSLLDEPHLPEAQDTPAH
ncbi:MAG: cbb3-type cytochrome c oxidase subunit I [Alicyclobacillaceae bacterium]|nr:cbb3-type cytochrome c oxidase subunit I [Alicyclobacillaceae bacterium]